MKNLKILIKKIYHFPNDDKLEVNSEETKVPDETESLIDHIFQEILIYLIPVNEKEMMNMNFLFYSLIQWKS